MVTEKRFEDYLKIFKNLRVDKNRNVYSEGKAPHKPILLLLVIVLNKYNKIDLNDIKINSTVREKWSEFWECLDYEKEGPIYLPMYHLKSDGFWHIDFKDSFKGNQPRSINGLNKKTDRIYLDKELIDHIHNNYRRGKLIDAIFSGGYFSKQEKNKLKEKLKVLDRHFGYKKEKYYGEEKMEGTYNLSPKKNIYKVAAQDIDPYCAIKELVDNAIDNWRRLSQMEDELNIKIISNYDKILIKDNSGGLREDEIPMLFTLGMTTEENIKGSIGAFGIGAKKAIIRLGKKAVLKSRYKDSKIGYGFKISEEWLEEKDWEVKKKQFTDMNSGCTRIVIRDLKINWTMNFEKDLIDELSKTYDLLLRKNDNLNIFVNDKKVKPQDSYEWSFTRFDGLFPRKFKNIILKNKEIPKPIKLHITVGLLQVGDQKNSGVDFYCQSRKVIENVKDERAGFYPKNKGGLGLFHSNHDNRLKVIIELETEHDASNLPWNSQKSEIKVHHPVTRELHKWMKEIVGPYFDLKTGDIRENAVKQFNKDYKFAANDGKIKEYDYSDRKNSALRDHLPNNELKEINSVIQKAENNFLDYYLDGIIHTSGLEEWQRPLYERELELLENNFKTNRIIKRAKDDLYNYIKSGEKNKRGLSHHEFDFYKYKLNEYKEKVDYESKIKEKAQNHLKEYIEEGETDPVGLNEIEHMIYEEELENLKKEYEEGNIHLNVQSIESNEDKIKIDVEIGGGTKPAKDIPVPVPRDKLDELCDYLGLPPESPSEEIGKKLADKIMEDIN
ncbi:MAG: ATP-binding protein [archaeon]